MKSNREDAESIFIESKTVVMTFHKTSLDFDKMKELNALETNEELPTEKKQTAPSSKPSTTNHLAELARRRNPDAPSKDPALLKFYDSRLRFLVGRIDYARKLLRKWEISLNAEKPPIRGHDHGNCMGTVNTLQTVINKAEERLAIYNSPRLENSLRLRAEIKELERTLQACYQSEVCKKNFMTDYEIELEDKVEALASYGEIEVKKEDLNKLIEQLHKAYPQYNPAAENKDLVEIENDLNNRIKYYGAQQ